MSEPPYTLHVWPAKWDLQSLDPTCLAAVMYLQLTIPGRFKVVSCTNPDQSPNGQLPFLTHAHTAVTTFPSIIAFVASLAKSAGTSGVIDLDASLTRLQKATKTAMYAHIEGPIADIVSHMFYGNDANFWRLTNTALASEMPIPQKYYVASRIREAHRPHLEVAGYWSLPDAEEEHMSLFERDKKKKRNYKVTFERAFEREKILGKAKAALGVHAGFLDGKTFFFGDRPTSLDVYFAAHILLLADPPFPDAVLQIQLLESYPGLVQHARRIQEAVRRAPRYERSVVSESLLGSLVPRPFNGREPQAKADPVEIAYKRRSLLFVLGAVAMTAAYIFTHVLFAVGPSEGSEDGSDIEEGEGQVEVEAGDENVEVEEEELAPDESEAFDENE